MKVVIVGPAYPYRGGIADTNHNLAMAFEELGHKSELVTFTLQYPQFLFPGKNQFSTESKPNLEINRKINSINPFSWFQAAKFINKTNPDLVIIRYWIPYLAPALGTVARRLKCSRIIAMCDNVIPHEPTRFDKSLSKYFLNSVNQFVTLSSHVSTELHDFGKTNVKSLFHPINTNLGKLIKKAEARKKLNLDSNKKYVLFFGLIRAYKGLDLLLKSIALAQDKKLHLIIAGEFYESEEKYRNIISEHNLENRVTVINQFIAVEEIPFYFCAADFLGLTYKSASQSGITQMAYHFHLPILATNVGGLSEMVEHKKVGFLTDLEPESIASGIDFLLENNRLEEYKENLKSVKTKYSWKAFVQKMLS